jgi:hypothetical protein
LSAAVFHPGSTTSHRVPLDVALESVFQLNNPSAECGVGGLKLIGGLTALRRPLHDPERAHGDERQPDHGDEGDDRITHTVFGYRWTWR